MDDNYSGDSSSGFSQKNSSAASSVSASVMNNAAASESARSSVEINAPKKKRASAIMAGGLREFSSRVCNILESKGTTTLSKFENVRRRVYTVFHVLEALDIVTTAKKEIKWKGRPSDRSIMNLEGMNEECVKLVNTIGRKTAYLKELEEQIADLEDLMLHNKQLLKNGNTLPEGFSLPFILVQTSSHASVEVEISEDMRVVFFDFNSTPFSLHDDATIVKLLQRHQRPERTNASQSASVHSSPRSGALTRPFRWNSETDIPKSK
ncbi:transcription factor-like protein DPA isoform X2 [Malus domestica]|uniref:transcription factor-like protein DPA isoform X2 n=1 Tax=Malus domestica TaxID=3750 RepID=UPI0039769157